MKKALAILAASFAVSLAHAAPVVIDFTAQAGTPYFATNTMIGGARFSPVCAVVVNTDQLWGNGSYLSVDAANNCGQFSAGDNPNYLGDPNIFADLFIDFFGQPFSLLSLASVVPFYNTMYFELRSSKGGYFKQEGATGTFNFEGPEWADVAWITLYDYGGDGFHNKHGWDNFLFDTSAFAFRIPEPATLILFGVVLPFALYLRRRELRKNGE